MSLVGPRHPLTYKLWLIDLFTLEQFHLYDVCLGIIDWAQINGLKDIEWHKRIEMKSWYVNQCSFYFDVVLFHNHFNVLLNTENESHGRQLNNA